MVVNYYSNHLSTIFIQKWKVIHNSVGRIRKVKMRSLHGSICENETIYFKMIILPPASRLFQTNGAYLKMLNATDAGLNFSTTEKVAPCIGDRNVTPSSSGSSDVISDNSMTVEDWLQNFQFIITLILLVFCE